MEFAITTLSQNGQVVIPSEIRKDAHLEPKTKFLIFNKEGNIFLKPMGEDQIVEEIRLMQDLLGGEEDLRKGRYLDLPAELDPKEMRKRVMKHDYDQVHKTVQKKPRKT